MKSVLAADTRLQGPAACSLQLSLKELHARKSTQAFTPVDQLWDTDARSKGGREGGRVGRKVKRKVLSSAKKLSSKDLTFLLSVRAQPKPAGSGSAPEAFSSGGARRS